MPHRKNFGRCLQFSASALALPALMSAPVGAGDHWLSGVALPSAAGPVNVPASAIRSQALAAVPAGTVFNITVSVEENPQTDAEKQLYEDQIRQFARAVYQSTNGAHKLGRISIFRNGQQMNRVDMQWYNDCPHAASGVNGPSAHPSGFGVAGKHIRHCTNWTGASYMSGSRAGGFTMAHEWGHYAYGLYDEYVGQGTSTWIFQPRAGDIEAIRSFTERHRFK